MECIKFEYEEKYIKDFIKLATKIYSKDDNMEIPDTMKSLLLDSINVSQRNYKWHRKKGASKWVW